MIPNEEERRKAARRHLEDMIRDPFGMQVIRDMSPDLHAVAALGEDRADRVIRYLLRRGSLPAVIAVSMLGQKDLVLIKVDWHNRDQGQVSLTWSGISDQPMAMSEESSTFDDLMPWLQKLQD